ncbi:unnamed protein product [Urochloa humidicola]
MLCSQPEAPRPRRARRLLAGDRAPGHAVLEESRRRLVRAHRLLDRRRGRVDPEGVHERGVRLQWQPDDHPLRVVGALGGAALPLVRVLVAAQRLRAEELAQAEVGSGGAVGDDGLAVVAAGSDPVELAGAGAGSGDSLPPSVRFSHVAPLSSS